MQAFGLPAVIYWVSAGNGQRRRRATRGAWKSLGKSLFSGLHGILCVELAALFGRRLPSEFETKFPDNWS